MKFNTLFSYSPSVEKSLVQIKTELFRERSHDFKLLINMHGYIDTSMLQALFTVERQPSCTHHPALTQPAMVDEGDV